MNCVYFSTDFWDLLYFHNKKCIFLLMHPRKIIHQNSLNMIIPSGIRILHPYNLHIVCLTDGIFFRSRSCTTASSKCSFPSSSIARTGSSFFPAFRTQQNQSAPYKTDHHMSCCPETPAIWQLLCESHTYSGKARYFRAHASGFQEMHFR